MYLSPVSSRNSNLKSVVSFDVISVFTRYLQYFILKIKVFSKALKNDIFRYFWVPDHLAYRNLNV